MHLGEWACAALGAIVVAPIVLLSIPIALPAAIISTTVSIRRFWRLRTGDVLGTTFVVLHPPKKGSEFRVLEINNYFITLHVWKSVDTAYRGMFRIIPESFLEIACDPFRCKKRLPMHEVSDLLTEDTTGFRVVNHDDGNRYLIEYVGEQDMYWMRCRSFELTRPVRVIQRAWRAHAAKRREAAARVITRAALHFLYRPNGWAYEAGSRRWHEYRTHTSLTPPLRLQRPDPAIPTTTSQLFYPPLLSHHQSHHN